MELRVKYFSPRYRKKFFLGIVDIIIHGLFTLNSLTNCKIRFGYR